jgi:hypothetical protein
MADVTDVAMQHLSWWRSIISPRPRVSFSRSSMPRLLVARADVQAEIQKVSRIEKYNLEALGHSSPRELRTPGQRRTNYASASSRVPSILFSALITFAPASARTRA